jgi:hypothetical protein
MEKHPITPPPELAAKWVHEIYGNPSVIPLHDLTLQVIKHAARWGADQELEACCSIALVDPVCGTKHQRSMLVRHIRERRRPKPPSLKEQALEALRHAPGPDYPNPITLLTADEHALIRRALEQLDD